LCGNGGRMSDDKAPWQPLAGVRVLDFSTYLPGPLASLMLAEAGAEVLKVEPPGGDPMRHLRVRSDDDGALFDMLNRGKRSVSLNLKSAAGQAFVREQIRDTDVLIEQFRPGVMQRLGCDYAVLSPLKPDLIYCSITGYGQSGPDAHKAGHDLNYQTEAGLVALATPPGAAPVLPSALFADIAAGAYPALTNILLALMQRDAGGQGACLDIAMADNLSPFLFWAYPGLAQGRAPEAAAELFTGGNARYRFYGTADNAWMALAPLEEPFWQRFCELIALAPELRDAPADSQDCADAVEAIMRTKSAAAWEALFAGEDVCCSRVCLPTPGALPPEAYQRINTLVSSRFTQSLAPAPALGEANADYGMAP